MTDQQVTQDVDQQQTPTGEPSSPTMFPARLVDGMRLRIQELEQVNSGLMAELDGLPHQSDFYAWVAGYFFQNLHPQQARHFFDMLIKERCNVAEMDAAYREILACSSRGQHMARMAYLQTRSVCAAKERLR